MSEVNAPTRMRLEHIVAELDNGNAAAAERDIRLLRDHWNDYAAGGPPPESFPIAQNPPAASSTKPTP